MNTGKISKPKLIRIVVLLCFVWSTFGTLLAEKNDSNPFLSPSQADGSNRPVEFSDTAKEPKPPFWYPIVLWQRAINEKLTSELSSLSEKFSFHKTVLIFFISLAYSLIHTAGPGHGKLILGTYFLTTEKKRRARDAALGGIIVSLTHIGMALVLSLFLYVIVNNVSMGSQREVAEITRRIGGIFVIITGIVILLSYVFRKTITSFAEERLRKKFQNMSFYSIAVISGIIPCPLAWFVLVFSFSYGVYGIGIISVLGMAMGAAITVSTAGLLVITLKDKAFGNFPQKLSRKVTFFTKICGGLLLVLLGISMTTV